GLAGCHPPAERPDEVLEDGVSTGVPLLPDFAQKDDAVVYSLTQTVHDILLVGVQLGRAPGTGLPGQGAVRIPQVAANCVPGDSQGLGDFPDRLFPLQLKDGFHFPTLQQSITPPTLAGIGSVFAGGWVNSFPPIMGQFITADHRGERARSRSSPFVKGPSPRVRGRDAANAIDPDGEGSIPARAGESCSVNDPSSPARVHPRACGGEHVEEVYE